MYWIGSMQKYETLSKKQKNVKKKKKTEGHGLSGRELAW
jgi:hypothetical protein